MVRRAFLSSPHKLLRALWELWDWWWIHNGTRFLSKSLEFYVLDCFKMFIAIGTEKKIGDIFIAWAFSRNLIGHGGLFVVLGMITDVWQPRELHCNSIDFYKARWVKSWKGSKLLLGRLLGNSSCDSVMKGQDLWSCLVHLRSLRLSLTVDATSWKVF